MEYKKYEFCKAVGCLALEKEKCQRSKFECAYTAKQFHKWLKTNGFIIIRKEIPNQHMQPTGTAPAAD